jgi:hypothetical protein
MLKSLALQSTATAFLILAITGCTTPNPGRSTTHTTRQQNDSTSELILAQAELRQKVEAENARLQLENKQLRAQNAALKNETKGKKEQENLVQRAISYLDINDYLVENKETAVKEFQKNWSPNGGKFFSLAGGAGTLLEFEVEDVFLYKGNVLITALCLSRSSDDAGAVGRLAITMDPDKDEMTGCTMLGQTLLSKQEMAALQQDNAQPKADPAAIQRLEQRASQIESKTIKDSEQLFTAEQKDFMIKTGVNTAATVGTALLIEAIKNYMKSK